MVFKSVYIRILILMVTEYGQDPYSDGHWIRSWSVRILIPMVTEYGQDTVWIHNTAKAQQHREATISLVNL